MFIALLGHFIAGGATRRGRNGSDVRPELCPRLRCIAGRRTVSPSARWRIAIQADLVPVTIGLIAARALIIAHGADRDWACFGITATTFALVYRTRISPLVAFAYAALLGLGGFV